MKNEDKGQISIELVLVVGAILTMVVVAIPMILKNAEMNRGLSAARDGATFAAGMRGMGYSFDGGNPSGVIKIVNMTVIQNGMTGDLEKYQIKFYISAPSEMIDNPTCVSSSIGGSIRSQATNYMNNAFNGNWVSGFAPVNGSYYSFTTSCEFV